AMMTALDTGMVVSESARAGSADSTGQAAGSTACRLLTRLRSAILALAPLPVSRSGRRLIGNASLRASPRSAALASGVSATGVATVPASDASTCVLTTVGGLGRLGGESTTGCSFWSTVVLLRLGRNLATRSRLPLASAARTDVAMSFQWMVELVALRAASI